ncbi:MAG TPA: hypothetical protein VG055_12715 [Planctomycetaceae bacterium]|jgi:hypothetical protein|nr:hypothetical protein [Planctomycetaceae bacterium]
MSEPMTDKPDGNERPRDHTAAIDAYIVRKGLTPRLDDATWQAVMEQIRGLFGKNLCYRCPRVTQSDDFWRRWNRVFPDAIRHPYRHIRHIEILLRQSAEMDELKRWLSQRHIEWSDDRKFVDDPEGSSFKIFGFHPDGT